MAKAIGRSGRSRLAIMGITAGLAGAIALVAAAALLSGDAPETPAPADSGPISEAQEAAPSTASPVDQDAQMTAKADMAARFAAYTALSPSQTELSDLRAATGGQDDAVHTATWRSGVGGPARELAVRMRPDDVRPLTLNGSGFPVKADAGFAAATEFVLGEVLGNVTDGRQLSGVEAPLMAGEATLSAFDTTLEAPWEQCWFFFVDDEPRANWEHPCRYVFVARDLSSYAVQYGRKPVEVSGAGPLKVLIAAKMESRLMMCGATLARAPRRRTSV